MGATCGQPSDDMQWVQVPAYSESALGCSTQSGHPTEELPRLGLGLRGQMSPGIRTSPKLPFFPTSDMEDVYMNDDSFPFICPEPVDNSPMATPTSFPVSSYVQSDAPVRKVSRHVNFASSPTHSVHRSEWGVQPYSEVYGIHPREFDFDEQGEKIPRNARPARQDSRSLEWHPSQGWESRDHLHATRSGYRDDRFQHWRPVVMSGENW